MKTVESFNELIEKYPKIFQLMKDPYYRISSEVPNGWIRTIDIMCNCIQNRIDNSNGEIHQLVCEQIKEKYGALAFYYYGGDAECEGMIDLITDILWDKCIDCGKEDNLGTTQGYIMRICKDCANINLKWIADEQQ